MLWLSRGLVCLAYSSGEQRQPSSGHTKDHIGLDPQAPGRSGCRPAASTPSRGLSSHFSGRAELRPSSPGRCSGSLPWDGASLCSPPLEPA